MCRLAITNKKDFMLYDNEYGIKEHWNHLEKECGGQGNGCVIYDNNKIIYFNKGVNLSIKTIYKNIKKRLDSLSDEAIIIFHTRIASVSSVKDKNCHPFVDGSFVLAMNGTEYDLSGIGASLGITDTEVMFKLLKDKSYKETEKVLLDMNSVYIGIKDNTPFAINNKGELEVWTKGTGSYHASSFQSKVKDVLVSDYGYVWKGGESNKKYYTTNTTVNSKWSKWSEMLSPYKSNNKHYLYDYESYDEYADYDDGYYYGIKTKKEKGISDEYSTGYDVGYDEGSSIGYEEGYEKGYKEGYEDAMAGENETPFFNDTEKGDKVIGF